MVDRQPPFGLCLLSGSIPILEGELVTVDIATTTKGIGVDNGKGKLEEELSRHEIMAASWLRLRGI